MREKISGVAIALLATLGSATGSDDGRNDPNFLNFILYDFMNTCRTSFTVEEVNR